MTDSPLFRRPDGRSLSEDHHLFRNSRGKFVIRATVDRGARFTGQRITVQTGTHDINVARRIRDAVVMGWIKAGCLTRDIVLSDA